MSGKIYYYQGIRNLKCDKTKFEYPEDIDIVEELEQIELSPTYFAEKYAYIVDPDLGRTVITLRDYQIETLNDMAFNNRVILNFSRQIGKTTTTAIFIIWYILTHTDKTIGIASYKKESATEILYKVKQIYNQLPIWLQFAVIEWNVESIEISNGCRVIADSTTKDSFRGYTCNLIYVDETAHIDDHMWIEFEDAVLPSISASQHSKLIYTSTPKGFNHFYRLCYDAQHGMSDFIYKEVPWNNVPGRDEKWKKKILSGLSSLHKEEMFKQNYECQFISLQNKFIDSDSLKRQEYITPINVTKEGFRIYKMPIKGHHYVTGVDTSKGVNRDKHAMVTLDVTNKPFEQVASYDENNDVTILQFTGLVYGMCKFYSSTAYVENNSYGAAICEDLLRSFNYDNIYRNNGQLGIFTGPKTKKQMVDNVKMVLDSNMIKINDLELIKQLSTFSRRNNGTYGAIGQNKDDLVIAMALALWILNDVNYDLSEDLKKAVFHVDDLEEFTICLTEEDLDRGEDSFLDKYLK